MTRTVRPLVVGIVLAVVLVASVAAATTIGSSGLPIGDVVAGVLSHLGIGRNPIPRKIQDLGLDEE